MVAKQTDRLKYDLHRMLNEIPALKSQLEREAIGLPGAIENPYVMAHENGRRSIAVEWLSLYNEVEDERKQGA